MLGDRGADYGLLLRMGIAENVYNAVRAHRRAKGNAIHQVPAAVQELYIWLIEQGYA